MEFIITVFCFLLILVLLVKILRNPKQDTSKEKLPPGPNKLPFIGNIHQLFGSSLPHHTLRDLANKYGPIMHLQLGEIPVVVVSSPEIAEQVFRTHDLDFANRQTSQASWILTYNHSDVAYAPYGDLWRQLRKICTLELLTVKRVKTFSSVREDEVLSMIRSLIISEQGQAVNLSKMVFSMNFSIIARAAFGKKSKYHSEFIAAAADVMEMLGGFNILDMFPSFKFLAFISGFRQKLQKIHNQVDKIVDSIINEHKEYVFGTQKRKEDLVDVMLNIQKNGGSDVQLTDKIIKAVIQDMFLGGGETTSTTIEWAMSELIRNPTIMKKAQDEVRKVYNERGSVDESKLDELKYLQAVVKETLRLHPPLVLLVPKECIKQCTISGYKIPEKTTIMVNAWALGRDPKSWVDAEMFNPDRFLESMKIEFTGNNFKYVPFGSGRRICLGISFAISNIHLSLAQLLFHFDWKLPDDIMPEGLDMIEKFALTVGRKNDLRLIPIPYQHSCLNKKQLK